MVENRRFFSVDPKFQVEGVAATNQSFSQKTRLNGLSYGIDLNSSVLSQFTRLTDRQTDGRTDSFLIARPRLHCMQRGKNTRCGNYFTPIPPPYILKRLVSILAFELVCWT